jgi:hypothetical protein
MLRIVSLLALFFAGTAAATPVHIQPTSALFDLYWGAVVRLQGDGQGPALYDSFNDGMGWGNSFRFSANVSDTHGSAYGSASGSLQSIINNNDASASLDAIFKLSAYATVTGNLPAGFAYGGGSVRNFIAGFDVLEPVIYIGSESLYGNGSLFASGSILQPGAYTNNYLSFAPFGVSTGIVNAGGSVIDSSIKALSYRFTAVPVPAAAPLMLLGLAGIGLLRRARPQSAR